MAPLTLQAKHAVLQWLAGFREACCLHRVVLYCIRSLSPLLSLYPILSAISSSFSDSRSRALSIRTGQCFLLNGLIFLGSLIVLNSFVIPILLWILPSHCEQFGLQHLCDHPTAMAFYSSLRFLLIEFFYVFWFYPLYVFSLILSNIWYNDIAKHAFDVIRRQGPSLEKVPNKKDMSNPQSPIQTGRLGGFEGVILGIGEQVYSILLLTFFFIEVLATGYIPYIGKAINFLLLSWMYKWNLSELSLEKRLDFFESNWAFFAGFGSPCVLAIFFFKPLVSYGVMAILFPLFVLAAAGAKAELVVESLRKSWGGGPGCRCCNSFRTCPKNSDP